MVFLSYAYDIGERKIIELIISRLARDPDEVFGVGRDDAVGKIVGDDKVIVAHTDMLVQETDMPIGMSYWQASRKAVVANISDLASKGAKPLGLLFSWGIPSSFRREDIIELADGLNAGAREYDTYVLGGDLSEASGGLVLAGMALGLASKDRLLSRSGAKPGDLVALTGPLGLTSIGFKILFEGLEAPKNVKDSCLESIYMPKARLMEGLALAEGKLASACMDISDGLAVSLHQMAEASHVGFTITDLPIPKEVAIFAEGQGLDPVELALYEGGEEFELLVCMRPGRWDEAFKAVKNVGRSLYKIGYVTEGREVVLRIDGRGEERIKAKGWEHFIRR